MTDDLKVIVDADASPLRRELTSAGGAVKIFGREVDQQSRSAHAFSAAVDKQKDSLHGLVSTTKIVGAGVAGGLAVAVGSMIKTGAAFEYQMARAQAVTGATNAEMGELKQLAIHLGAVTKFSAGEAAEGMYELASAGFDVKETQAALPGVLDLAAASSIGLAEAAEINSNALRGFGLASSESTHVADVLAQSVNSSSVEMQDLQLSLKYIGPVAKATGEGFEEMISAVSLMGDAGIKGEQAGTSLRQGLLRLVKPTKQVEEGIGTLGLKVEDLQGPKGLLPLPQLVAKLQEGLQGLSSAQKAQALAQIFGTESLSGMLTVVDAGPAKLRTLTTEFEHSGGAAAKAAKTMNDTVKGAWEELTGSFETIEIEVFEKFAPELQGALKEATGFVNTQGADLQKALANAMATPEFKRADFGRKAEIILEAIGEVWKDSGLGPDIREGLIDAFNWALPRVADAVGKSSVTVAETFVKGFLEASPLGKLAIAGWLFVKLGGFAALRAAGSKAGAEVAAGMATSIEAGAAASTAATTEKQLLIANASGSVVGSKSIASDGEKIAAGAAAAGATGVASKASSILDKAMKAAGVVAGGYFAAEFGAKAIEGITGKDLLENQSLAASLTHGFNTKGVLRVEVDTLQKGEGLNFHKSQAQLESLEDAFEETMRKIRSDAAVGLGGIQKALATGLDQANQTWLHGTTPWRQHTVQAMRAAIAEIKKGMQAGTIETAEGQKEINRLFGKIHLTTGSDPFGLAQATTKQFKELNAITAGGTAEWTRKLRRMPVAARESTREATTAMLTAWSQGHPKLEAQVANLTRYEIHKFGGANRQLEASTAATMASIAKSASEGAAGTGAALTNIFTNLSGALVAVGASKIPTFSATVLSAASQYHHIREATQSGLDHPVGKAMGGFFVGGGDRRDHVHAVLGSREAVLTIHDQPEVQASLALGKAMGVTRNGSLGELFSGPRKPNYFAKGGFAGGTSTAGTLPHPGLVGPEPVRTLGQDAINLGFDAAQTYLRKHLEPQRVLAMLKAAEAGAAKGYPYVFGGGHGSFAGPWDCSGFVSYILHAGGFLDSPMSVQQGSGLYTLGAAGPGKFFTWGVRGTSGANAHTMISIKKPNDSWGFFESGGSGGGAHEDSGWDGSFQFRHMPGFAKGGFVGGKASEAVLPSAVRNAIAAHGQEVFDPKSKNFVGWGFARGGFVGDGTSSAPFRLSVGGPVPPKGGEIVGASTYGGPADSVSNPSYGAWGASHPFAGHNAFAELAMGKALGDLAFGTKLKISRAGHSVIAEKMDIGAGGGDVGGHNRAIDLHYETGKALGVLGGGTNAWLGTVQVEPSSGSAASSAKQEKVPATYQGCRTAALTFGSMPKSLKGVDKELARRKAELPRYRAAVKAAAKASKTKTEHALKTNVTNLETRVGQLERERAKLRREVAKKKVTRRLTKALAKVTGAEALIEAARTAYEKRSEHATRLVDLEPTMPVLSSSASEGERWAAEIRHDFDLKRYIEQQEEPAYLAVLASENEWRNAVLGAETLAAGAWQKGRIGGMEGGFEGRLQKIRERIAQIRAMPSEHTDKWWHEHPKAFEHLHEMLSKLPLLRFKEQEVAKALSTTREAFYPGGADVLQPKPPLPGTGSLEGDLAEVQGRFFPDLHERLKALPTTRDANGFGGAIWDTQEAIEGLGMKIAEAVPSGALNFAGEEEGEAGGAETSTADTTAWTAAKEALSLERQQNYLLGQGELGIFRQFLAELGPGVPYLGAFMTGTRGLRVGRTGMAMLHRDEMVVPDPKGPANSQFASAGATGTAAHHTINLTLRDKAAELVELVDARVDGRLATVNRDLGRDARRRRTAPGRA